MATFRSARRDTSASATNLPTGATVAVTAGDVIVVKLKWEGATTTASVADGVDTYTAIGAGIIDGGNTDFWTRCFYTVATTTGNRTITGTLTGGRVFIEMDVIVGIPAASTTFSIETSQPQASGTSNAPSAGSITLTAAGFAVELFGCYNTAGWTKGAAFTVALDGTSPTGSPVAGYALPSGSGSLTANATVDDIVVWTAQGASFKQTAAGSTYTLTCDQASYGLTGNATGLVAARKLTCDQQSYALTGQAVTLTYTSGGARTLTCDQASYTLTGFDVLLSPQSPPAFYTLTGNDVGLLASTRVLTCDQASYGLTGNATNFLTTHVLTAAQVSYTLTGNATNLIYSNAPASGGAGIDSVRPLLRPYLGVKRRMVAVGL